MQLVESDPGESQRLRTMRLVLTSRLTTRVGVQEWSLNWEDAESAMAFKVDGVTYDIIILRFVTGDGTVDIDEEAEGWAGLLDALPRYLPGSLTSPAIFEAVALPPFATNTMRFTGVDNNETCQ
jgi:hypothetical protein